VAGSEVRPSLVKLLYVESLTVFSIVYLIVWHFYFITTHILVEYFKNAKQ
jgi:hypothetical protein